MLSPLARKGATALYCVPGTHDGAGLTSARGPGTHDASVRSAHTTDRVPPPIACPAFRRMLIWINGIFPPEANYTCLTARHPATPTMFLRRPPAGVPDWHRRSSVQSTRSCVLPHAG